MAATSSMASTTTSSSSWRATRSAALRSWWCFRISSSQLLALSLLLVALLLPQRVDSVSASSTGHAGSRSDLGLGSSSGSAATASGPSVGDGEADPQVDALLKKLKDADTSDCSKQEQRSAFEQLTLEHFNASCQAAFAHKDPSLLRGFNRTQLYLGKCLQGSNRWATSLVDASNLNRPSDDVHKFTEFALLYHLQDNAGSLPGEEIGGSILDHFMETVEGFAKQAKLINVSAIWRSEDFGYYANLSKQLCTAQASIRFCLMQVLDRQRSVIDNVDVYLGDPHVLSRFDEVDVNVNLKTLSALLEKKKSYQELNLAVVQEFNQMVTTIHESADKTIETVNRDFVAAAFDKIQSINDEFMNKAAEDNRTDAVHDEEAALATKNNESEQIRAGILRVNESFWSNMAIIGEAALKVEKGKEHHSFWHMLASVVKLVLVPFEPSVIGDYMESVHQFSNDLKGADNVRALIQITKMLTVTIADRCAKLQTMDRILKGISASVDPILKAGADAESLDKHAQTFLDAMKEYEAPVSPAEMEGIVTSLRTLRSDLCGIAGDKAATACSEAEKSFDAFTSLSTLVLNSREILKSLREMASDSVRTKSAEIFGNAVNASRKEATDTITKLQENNDKNSIERKDRIALLHNHFRFGETSARIQLILTQIKVAKTAYQICHIQTYLNGGVPLDICNGVYAVGDVDDVAMDKITVVKDHVSKDSTKLRAFIPTVPANMNDSAFIDLPTLMSGHPVHFQLPSNETLLSTWLRKNNWVTEGIDIKSHTGFIKKMQLILPPAPQGSAAAPLATTVAPKSSSQVSVRIEASDYSDMGPALNHKRYQIPPCVFVTQYRENSRTCPRGEMKSPYADCDAQLGGLCMERDGALNAPDEHNLLPSMFSPFQVTVNATSLQAQAFEGISASIPLAVDLEIVILPIDASVWASSKLPPTQVGDPMNPAGTSSNADPSRSALLGNAQPNSTVANTVEADENLTELTASNTVTRKKRSLQAASPNFCCKEDAYVIDLSLGTCAPCPAGSLSQLGGLYCVSQLPQLSNPPASLNGYPSSMNTTLIPVPSSTLANDLSTTSSPGPVVFTPMTAPGASQIPVPTPSNTPAVSVPTPTTTGGAPGAPWTPQLPASPSSDTPSSMASLGTTTVSSTR